MIMLAAVSSAFLLVAVVYAAGHNNTVQETKTIPGDFSVRYEWHEGTVPPPYHYEYVIHLGSSSKGRIVFWPDYQMYKPPVWTYTFEVSSENLYRLYLLVVKKDLFRKSWTEIDNGSVGGSLEWLEVTINQKSFKVPSHIEESEDIKDVYLVIRSLVPESIWDKLMSNREQFISNYQEAQE